MAENKTRVDFNAPESLVEEADTVAELLGESRTQLLIDGLRKELEDVVGDESFQRRVREAYYDDEIDFATVRDALGTDEAIRVRLLKESLAREVPAPDADDVDIPSDGEFYDGDVSTWTPDDKSDSDGGER
jgi:hypothetical protein